MIKKEARNVARVRRHVRVRKNITGTKECPRLNVFRSNKGIYAQVIDDVTGSTLASSSNLELKIKNGLRGVSRMRRQRQMSVRVKD